MKATALLASQHRKVEALFKKLENDRVDFKPVLAELADSLAAHMTIEQELFYPAIKQIDPDVVNEAYEEHAVAELELKRLLATDHDDEAYAARVTTLKELIAHHVEEEEELFPQVEKKFDEEQLKDLGKVMKERFEEVVKAGFSATVPNGMTQTSSDKSKKRPPKDTSSVA